MGWLLFWAAVVVVLALMWLSPYLRRRRLPRAGAPGSTDPRTERVLREAERAHGQMGKGLPGGGFGGGG